MSKHNPDPQNHPTPDQIKEAKNREEARILELARKRNRVETELFPFLKENSTSVEDAKMLCQIITAGVRQAFGNVMRERNVESLGLTAQLNPADPRFLVMKELLAMFGAEKISDALEMVEGLPPFLDGCVTQEMNQRKLEDLKVEFLTNVPKV